MLCNNLGFRRGSRHGRSRGVWWTYTGTPKVGFLANIQASCAKSRQSPRLGRPCAAENTLALRSARPVDPNESTKASIGPSVDTLAADDRHRSNARCLACRGHKIQGDGKVAMNVARRIQGASQQCRDGMVETTARQWGRGGATTEGEAAHERMPEYRQIPANAREKYTELNATTRAL